MHQIIRMCLLFVVVCDQKNINNSAGDECFITDAFINAVCNMAMNVNITKYVSAYETGNTQPSIPII
jgi:hypothetical protein